MHFRLVRSVKRKGTINQQFNQRIPADVRDRAIGVTLHIPVGPQIVRKTITARDHAIRVSLRASTPSESKMRQAQVAGYLETVWQGLREPPLVLSHRQAVALSRDVYAWGSLAEIDPELADAESAFTGETGSGVYKNAMARLEAETDLSGPGPTTATARQILIRRGLPNVATESVELLAREVLRSLKDGFAQGDRETAGDYTPDPKANRFPALEIEKPPTFPANPAAEVSLVSLVDDWWLEAKGAGRAVSTYDSYKGTVARFVAFLQHDDALAVTPDDVVRFKDHRLAAGVSPKTVGDGDVAGLRAVFKWAVGNKKLPTNPALGIQVVRKKAVKLREKDFTPEEAKLVLTHSLNHAGRESAKLKAAKRWVPWLCAYTGARVGEIVQLRKEDFRQVTGGSEAPLWVMTITPEAGTVKDKEVREVVLHDHLLTQGLLIFVTAAPSGYLFLTPRKKDGVTRGVWQSVKNRLREFVREVVTDERVQPNHAWRHTFKTIGREAGIADSVLDAICGHAAKTVGGAYGSVTLKAQRDAMERFPKFNAMEGSSAMSVGSEGAK
nr:tyrosine-type recombinase/integrase [Mesorhizobium sp. LNHC220B00]